VASTLASAKQPVASASEIASCRRQALNPEAQAKTSVQDFSNPRSVFNSDPHREYRAHPLHHRRLMVNRRVHDTAGE
jgi:hypothetical protein